MDELKYLTDSRDSLLESQASSFVPETYGHHGLLDSYRSNKKASHLKNYAVFLLDNPVVCKPPLYPVCLWHAKKNKNKKNKKNKKKKNKKKKKKKNKKNKKKKRKKKRKKKKKKKKKN